MEFRRFTDAVLSFNFIQDREVAESMVKAVLGILASRMDEPQARILTNELPEPLTYEKLRGHQARIAAITAEQCYDDIATEFHLDRNQARDVVTAVLHVLKRDIAYETLDTIEEGLPGDWIEAIERA